MYKNVWFSFLLRISLLPCGPMCFPLSSARLPLLFSGIFHAFLHSWLVLLPALLEGESSGNFLFSANQQMTALPLPCYEQLCSSCKRKWLELAAWSKKGLEFSKEGHLSGDASGSCCCIAPWMPSGFYRFECSGQILLCLLPVLDDHGSSLE